MSEVSDSPADVRIKSGAVIVRDCVFVGPGRITIGEGTLIHPRCRIEAM